MNKERKGGKGTVDAVDADRMDDTALSAYGKNRHPSDAQRGNAHDDEDAHVQMRCLE